MALLGIDEIRTPKEFDSEKFISEYFKPMRISKERKEIREEAARDFRDFLLFILALIATESAYNALNWAYIEEQFRLEMEKAALEYARRSQELEDYIAEKASDFVSVTRDKDLSDPYWTSDERATMEAVNEANDVVGYEELQQAIEDGYTHKIWKTENDSRVRKTHRAVEGKKIPIRDMFEVGDGLMRYPHDWYYNAKECYNCRCALVFTDKDGKVNKTDEKVQYTNEENRGIVDYKGTGIFEIISSAIASKISDIAGMLKNNKGSIPLFEDHSKRAEKVEKFSPNWEVASLSEALKRFAPGNVQGIISVTGQKIEYHGDRYKVLYDPVFDYFRIVDKTASGKNVFVMMDGTNPTNIKQPNGKYAGSGKSEYRRLTHYKNGDE